MNVGTRLVAVALKVMLLPALGVNIKTVPSSFSLLGGGRAALLRRRLSSRVG